MNQIQYAGLDDLRTALQHLPEDLASQAGQIVSDAAFSTAGAVEANYPQGRSGNLKRGVKSSVSSSRLAASATVTSAAPHAMIFERGTKLRRTKDGANRGAMPAAPDVARFIPRAIRARRQMTDNLIALLEENGLLVTT